MELAAHSICFSESTRLKHSGLASLPQAHFSTSFTPASSVSGRWQAHFCQDSPYMLTLCWEQSTKPASSPVGRLLILCI